MTEENNNDNDRKDRNESDDNQNKYKQARRLYRNAASRGRIF